MLETRDIYWAAGFLDGEGSFRFTKTKSMNVSAPQKDKQLLNKLMNLFGGQIYERPNIFQWQLSGDKATGLMMTLYPLMSDKRKEQICKALEAWKANSFSNHKYIAVFGKCKNGHDWIKENIIIHKNGQRRCKLCLQNRSRIYSKQYYLGHKETIKNQTKLNRQKKKEFSQLGVQ